MTITLEEPRTTPRISSVIATTSHGVPLGAAAAMLACGWAFAADRLVDPHYVWTSVATVLALVLLVRPIAWRGLLQRVYLAPFQISVVLTVLFSADRVLAAWEEHAPAFPAVSALASRALNAIGYRTAAERGLLFIDHPEGLVTILPSIEKLAVRPLLLFWLAWVVLRLIRDYRGIVVGLITVLATTVLVGMARYIVLVTAYIEHEGILSGSEGQAALDRFTSPWITGFFLVVAGFAADRAGRLLAKGVGAQAPAPVRPRARPMVASVAVIALLGAAAGLAFCFVPPGKEKPGRVLIDDRFCGIWEPTARQFDTEWYGDFPTYSFTSLAEWLGKWFSVDANTTRPYDDELLSQYDVLIIKTPEEPIPDAETAAIERFVRRGGGLLLVGDHTNLLGMGTHLNALSANDGIQFRYDSVSDGLTGGFVNCAPPSIGRHLGALHVEKLEFMTSCSLQLSGGCPGQVPRRG